MAGKLYTALMLKMLHGSGEVTTILDVGAGEGTYRDLISPPLPGVTWIGVEVWAPYIEQFHLRERYDRLICCDIRGLDPATLPDLDVTIFGDILEHMTKVEAQALVQRYLGKSRFIVISLPIGHYPQDEVNANPFEVHVKDNWSHQEIVDSFPGIAAACIHFGIGVYFLSEAPEGHRKLEILQSLVPNRVKALSPGEPLRWPRLPVGRHGPGMT
jgi:hypothetical protein